jgi:hypothetical protein
MVRTLGVGLLATVTLAAGCLPNDFLHPETGPTGATAVPTSPFTTTSPAVIQTTSATKPAQAAPETAIAVDKVGQQLLAANKSLGMKPLFLTIGAPQPEIFHRDTSALLITEGLVKQCKTEAQLAALMSVELGRMVSEREVLASPAAHNPDKNPPITVTMGNAGQFSGLDQLQQVEMDKLGCDRHRPVKRFVPPDPLVLARGYLEAAGFDRSQVDAVAPLLAQAEKNYELEKQLKGPSTTPTWTPQ